MDRPFQFSIEDVTRATHGRLVCRGERQGFFGVSTDSRTVKPGELYVALRGQQFDGHDFLRKAFEDGAAGAVVERALESTPSGQALWQVPDALQALGDLARFHRDRFRLPVIGITGSSGKTTTKSMVAHILSESSGVLSTAGTQNNQVGLPQTLLRLQPEHQVAVLELGTNHWGEIDYLTRILRPGIGMVTNIGHAHLESFGDLEGVLKAKGELWRAMSSKGVLIFNGDDPMLRMAAQDIAQGVLWVSLEKRPHSEIWATDIETGIDFIQTRVNGRLPLRLPLPGRRNLGNALMALACATLLGRTLPEAIGRLEEMPPLPGRLQFQEVDGIWVLDDSYNANPDSLQSALEVFASYKSSGRKIAVLGDMMELGIEAQAHHVEAGRWVAQSGVDDLIAVGPLSRQMLSSAWDAGLPIAGGVHCATAEEAGEVLANRLERGDALLIKGSRSMRMERVLECFSISSTR